jgi:hypothetical protein
MTNDPRNLRHLQGMAPQANPARDGKARPRQLPALDCLDVFASAWVMFSAFTSRSLSNAGQINLAEIGKGVK